MTGTLSTPGVGSPNSTEDPKVATAITTLNGLLDGSNKLDGAQLSAVSVAAASLASNSVTTAKITDANVTDAKLASPNNSVYRTIFHLSIPAGSNAITSAGTVVPFLNISPGIGLVSVAALAPSGALPSFYFDDADYTVGSLTQKLRLRYQVLFGTTSSAPTTLTVGLYPLSTSGGTYSLGSVVSGSTVAISTFTANTTQQGNSGDFTIPSDGQYCLAFAYAGGSSYVMAHSHYVQVQNRSV